MVAGQDKAMAESLVTEQALLIVVVSSLVLLVQDTPELRPCGCAGGLGPSWSLSPGSSASCPADTAPGRDLQGELRLHLLPSRGNYYGTAEKITSGLVRLFWRNKFHSLGSLYPSLAWCPPAQLRVHAQTQSKCYSRYPSAEKLHCNFLFSTFLPLAQGSCATS